MSTTLQVDPKTLGTPPTPGTPQEAFDARWEESDDHWMWTGRTNSAGFPVLGMQRTQWRGTRLSLKLAGRPVPSTHEAVQVCGERLCVNPDHLQAFSIAERRTRPRQSRSESLNLQRMFRSRSELREVIAAALEDPSIYPADVQVAMFGNDMSGVADAVLAAITAHRVSE